MNLYELMLNHIDNHYMYLNISKCYLCILTNISIEIHVNFN